MNLEVDYLSKKTFGPYVIGSELYWRNYHREIKHPLAKSQFEVEYLELWQEYYFLHLIAKKL